MMLKGFCLLVLVTVVHCKAKKCCFPQNWQLRESSISAYANNKTKELQMFTVDIFFDSVEQKIRQDFFTSKDNLTILELYNAHVGFKILNNKKCTLFEPGHFPPTPICIPDTWKRVDQYRLGLKPSINVAEYGYSAKVSTYVGVTDNCVPVSVTSFGFPTTGTMSLYAASFENYLPDIPDPSVFHVPAICKHALRDYEFIKEPLHEKMFWREMFAEY
ncbi:uncharacterized protein LOC132748079 [Ruditapes philippinarum]|uniref:uncharacterized protein LOC132748079 n=1 Tax=Ruditapes philippinarum TaxID=129788 RepID=UPI00295C0CE1|nr:uncharacterized protein LOC132748079 [Ruditapes philippinarum]XP_060593607.1 uncharacterized protein LOC132748079 [Ruditapes philippinarum]